MGDKILNITHEEIIAEVVSMLQEYEFGPEWFSASELAEQMGKSVNTISKLLGSKWRSGELERRKHFDGCFRYRLKNGLSDNIDNDNSDNDLSLSEEI